MGTAKMNNYEIEFKRDPLNREVALELDDLNNNRRQCINGLEALAEKGSVIAMIAVGDALLTGRYGTQIDEERGIEYFKKAKQMGSIEAAYRLARYLEAKKDYAQAELELRALCEQNFSPAAYLLGHAFYTNRLGKTDKTLAIRYLEKAAKEGHYHAMRWLALIKWRHGSPIQKISSIYTFIVSLWVLFRQIRVSKSSDSLRKW